LASDGSFDEYSEDYVLTTEALTGGTHIIQIRARNSVGNYSPLITDTIVVLAVPTGVTVSDGLYTDRIQLNWDAVASATSYEVWRDITPSPDSASLIATTESSSYEDRSVTPEQIYYYWIKARHLAWAGEFSPADSGWRELVIPVDVLASDGIYIDRVRVTWAPVFEATGYTIYRAMTLSGDKLLIGHVTHSGYYDDFSAEAQMTYYYFVTASNGYGSSDYSGPDSGYFSQLYRIYLSVVMK
jgi:hypothetical protein